MLKKEDIVSAGYYWYRKMPLYPTWGIVEIRGPAKELGGNLTGFLDELADTFEFVGPIKEPPC